MFLQRWREKYPSDCFVVFFSNFNFLNVLQSDNYSSYIVYVRGHKCVLGPRLILVRSVRWELKRPLRRAQNIVMPKNMNCTIITYYGYLDISVIKPWLKIIPGIIFSHGYITVTALSRWSDMISFHCSEMISYHFTVWTV